MEMKSYKVNPIWKPDELNNKWNRNRVYAPFPHQEGSAQGSGQEWKSTEPQWELNHDQKKGVRIGEAK
eukprot:11886760-Heterocapsa_arctica.AAC.1